MEIIPVSVAGFAASKLIHVSAPTMAGKILTLVVVIGLALAVVYMTFSFLKAIYSNFLCTQSPSTPVSSPVVYNAPRADSVHSCDWGERVQYTPQLAKTRLDFGEGQ